MSGTGTYVATFFSHYGALSFSKRLESEGMTAKMMPVPRRVSSSCGTGVRLETDRDVNGLVTEDVDKVFRLDGDVYTLVFEN